MDTSYPIGHPIDRRALLLSAGAGAIAGLMGSRTGSAASRSPVVVELFTSQGCSSCPPADAFMRDLVKQPGVIAVSYNVDYWDYLGWRDTLGSPVFSRRQRDYARRRGDGKVYTPQMVIDGRRHEVGSRRKAVYAAIAEEGALPGDTTVPMHASETPSEIVIDVGGAPTDRIKQESTIWVLVVEPQVVVPITRGENAGSKISYSNVVRRMIPAGMWHGEATTLKLPKADLMADAGEFCVALLQVGGVGPIIGATMYRD
jgi:hypothetical protein